MTLQRAFGALVALAVAAVVLCASALALAVRAGSVSLEARAVRSLDGIAAHLAEAYARESYRSPPRRTAACRLRPAPRSRAASRRTC